MSIEDLKSLFGTQETILELVQLDDGVLALRHSNSDDEPLVKITFNEEVKALIGEETPLIAQHMIQAGLIALMDSQMRKLRAEIADERPRHYS